AAVGALRAAGVRTFIEAGPDGSLSGVGPAPGDPEQDEAGRPGGRRGRGGTPTPGAGGAGGGARRGGGGGAGGAGRGGGGVPAPARGSHPRRYWLPPARPADPAGLGQEPAGHPLLGAAVELPAAGSLVLEAMVESPTAGGLVLTGRISLAGQPWLADHV